ncbi:hypothetical protein AVEN_11225-1 [Araneus ventricosus]|uniref:Uncharacterized protein n=1 Tax=Araneus ventricosus TaxID=182803 RepID=A0A4Y2QCS4_ARAVE|nr:hypothetical protein AVEN_11225-1 [Araneus ventricosus]
MSFYITCPSDGSLVFHPENTLSHYFTKLPSPVDLTGEWEVGIVEFIYPRMWNNVTNDSNYYEYDLGNGVIKSGRIDCGYYETLIDILNALPKHVKIQMNYNKHSEKDAKAVGKQALRLDIDVANDLLQDKEIKPSVKQRAKEAAPPNYKKTCLQVGNL